MTLYDMEKLFSQFIIIADKRKIKLDYVFQVWDVTSTKVTLQGQKLAFIKTEQSNVDAIIIDGQKLQQEACVSSPSRLPLREVWRQMSMKLANQWVKMGISCMLYLIGILLHQSSLMSERG